MISPPLPGKSSLQPWGVSFRGHQVGRFHYPCRLARTRTAALSCLPWALCVRVLPTPSPRRPVGGLGGTPCTGGGQAPPSEGAAAPWAVGEQVGDRHQEGGDEQVEQVYSPGQVDTQSSMLVPVCELGRGTRGSVTPLTRGSAPHPVELGVPKGPKSSGHLLLFVLFPRSVHT